ncbi:MFS transporter [Terrimonas sp. NA20]|uniref:MFS transporter n=1 Tax=Terrimonas ginsenosidimutans TaxID=2908004 RepID=A0ABS9KUF3_9BACT|nr:MFS transporter [Terrimonas ginsenosidimutans]MCG2615910.1 MFS transporter [Terrimonas ginsenosidimutans]
MTRKELIILLLLAGLNFTHFLDFMVMMPLNNYLTPYFNISPRQFSFMVSAYSISAAVSGFATAFIVDSYDRKKILLYSYAGFIAGTIACGLATSYPLLLAARIVAGLFGGIIGAQVLAIIADIFPYERRGKAMASVSISFAIASILGVPFSLYLANLFHEDWHVPFLFVAGIGLVLIPFVIRFVPAMRGHLDSGLTRTPPLVLLGKVIRTNRQISALIFSCLLMIGHFLIIPFITPYMEFNKGYSKNVIPTIYLVGGGASLIAALLLGRLSDKKGKLPIYSWSVFLSLFMVLLLTKMPVMPFSLVLTVFAFWFVFATGRALTAQAMISEVVPPEQRGSFMSFNGCVQQIGTGLASLLAGFIVYDDPSGKIYRYEWLGYISIFVLVITIVMARLIFRKMDEGKVKSQN